MNEDDDAVFAVGRSLLVHYLNRISFSLDFSNVDIHPHIILFDLKF